MKRFLTRFICLVLTVAMCSTCAYAGALGDIVVEGHDQTRNAGNAVVGGAVDATGDFAVDAVQNYGQHLQNFNNPYGNANGRVVAPAPPGSNKLPAPLPTNTRPQFTPSPSANSGLKLGSFLNNGAKVGGAALAGYSAVTNTTDFVTNRSEHETEAGQRIDEGLRAANTTMSIVVAVGAVAAVVGAPITVPAGGAVIVISTALAVASNSFHGKSGRDLMDFVTGRKKLGFTPIENNEGLQDGLDVINDEFGFDLYPGRGHSKKVNVKKPNIYLYADSDMDVRITLGNAQCITASIPEYKGGWDAAIRDGSLNACEDYLFYEAAIDESLLQKTSGYVLRAGRLEEDLEAVLDATLYSAKEKADFLEYWLGELDSGTDYLMCPQSFEAIEGIMKLYSSVEPDSVNRYWYWFVPLPEEYEEAGIVPAVRDGYTIVEWGGILD